MKHDIRQMLLVDREAIKALMLTEQETVIYNKIRGAAALGSVDISRLLGITIQHASNALKRIYDKGYTLKIVESSETGGHEHKYAALYPDNRGVNENQEV
jgi:predicted transcriptional regulator